MLWIVTAWPGGQLALLARLPVGLITDRAGAIEALGTDDVYEAPLHALAPQGAAEPMRDLDLTAVAADLRFESSKDRLRVSADGRVEPTQLQTMRLLTAASVELLESVWRQPPDPVPPGGEAWYLEAEYRDALVRAEPRISPLQRRMLVAHAEAPDRMLSVRQLAAAAGYDKPQVTYAQYGRLGYVLAEALGHPDQMKVWTYMIGDGWRTQDGTLIWEIYPELAQALVSLGWASRAGAPDVFGDLATLDAEFDAEPEDGSQDTTRAALVQARIGQGPFRADLVRYWGACAVTGVSEPAVLRASHIKPWRAASNAERLDPYNGLLLAAHLDALFDAGLITFDAKGQMLVSSLLAPEDRAQLGLADIMRLRGVEPAHQSYLEYHRAAVFRSGVPSGVPAA